MKPIYKLKKSAQTVYEKKFLLTALQVLDMSELYLNVKTNYSAADESEWSPKITRDILYYSMSDNFVNENTTKYIFI